MASFDFERWRLPVQPLDLIITDGLFGKEAYRPQTGREVRVQGVYLIIAKNLP